MDAAGNGRNMPGDNLRYGVSCDVPAEAVAGYYNASLTMELQYGHASVSDEFVQNRMNAYQIAPDDTPYMLQVGVRCPPLQRREKLRIARVVRFGTGRAALERAHTHTFAGYV
jgi:hypothetical protein